MMSMQLFVADVEYLYWRIVLILDEERCVVILRDGECELNGYSRTWRRNTRCYYTMISADEEAP